MSSLRCTVSIKSHAPMQSVHAYSREHGQEQKTGLRCQREGWSPNQCRILGYRSCCCTYPPCRWWRYPPLRSSTIVLILLCIVYSFPFRPPSETCAVKVVCSHPPRRGANGTSK